MSLQIRKKIKNIIFGTDTPMGKLFDIILIMLIILSVLVVLLDSIKEFHYKYANILYNLEIIFTILFTIEYFLRIYCILSLQIDGISLGLHYKWDQVKFACIERPSSI